MRRLLLLVLGNRNRIPYYKVLLMSNFYTCPHCHRMHPFSLFVSSLVGGPYFSVDLSQRKEAKPFPSQLPIRIKEYPIVSLTFRLYPGLEHSSA